MLVLLQFVVERLSISADSGLGAVPGSATAGHLTLNGGTLQSTASFTLNSKSRYYSWIK